MPAHADLRQIAREQRVAVLASAPTPARDHPAAARTGARFSPFSPIGQRHVDREIGGQRRMLALGPVSSAQRRNRPFRCSVRRRRAMRRSSVEVRGRAEQSSSSVLPPLGMKALSSPAANANAKTAMASQDAPSRPAPGSWPALGAALSPKENTGTRNSVRASAG